MSARDWNAETGRDIVRACKHLDGALLPVLHALQEHFGYVDPAAVPVIADELNLSRAEVYGVISFYHDFRDQPPHHGRFGAAGQRRACQPSATAVLTESNSKGTQS